MIPIIIFGKSFHPDDFSVWNGPFSGDMLTFRYGIRWDLTNVFYNQAGLLSLTKITLTNVTFGNLFLTKLIHFSEIESN